MLKPRETCHDRHHLYPDYLKPALERLAAARAAHLEQARRMEGHPDGHHPRGEQKAELKQDNGSDTRTWRAAFRAGAPADR